MGVPCVQCGYCCTVRPCSYGKWDERAKQCAFLDSDNRCTKYAEIVEHEKESKYPMMGCGCSSSMFNERREAKLNL